MIAAEKRYEYQGAYQSHSLDGRPQRPKRPRRKPNNAITAKDKMRILALTIVTGILCIGLIVTTAYAASIKYDTNRLIKENNALEAEIEALNVEIYSVNNIEAIEQKATKKQGMVYPSSKQIIYLTEEEKPGKGFAKRLRKQAYN